MSEVIISTALEKALVGVAFDLTALGVQNVPIVWRGQGVASPSADAWIEAAFMGEQSKPFDYAGSKRDEQGFLQATCKSLVSPDSPKITRMLSDQIIEAFPLGRALYEEGVKVWIHKETTRLSGFAENGVWHRPVSIYWRCVF